VRCHERPRQRGALERLDPGSFAVMTQTSLKGRIALLRIHRRVRNIRPGFTYLKIGSIRGGSLLPHLLDPLCKAANSIDKRPAGQPDARARRFVYRHVSTGCMLHTLRAHVTPAQRAKLATFDVDASELAPEAVGAPVDLALIDGEHTNVAAFRDFVSILPMLAPSALVAFHHVNRNMDAICNIEVCLKYRGIVHRLYLLADLLAVLALGGAADGFAGVALDRTEFTRTSRRRLHEMIVRSVAAGTHLAAP
jgi:hypothetical protein